MLHNLGYTRAELIKSTGNSLRNLFYGESKTFLEPDRFPHIAGLDEGDMITSDGTPMKIMVWESVLNSRR